MIFLNKYLNINVKNYSFQAFPLTVASASVLNKLAILLFYLFPQFYIFKISLIDIIAELYTLLLTWFAKSYSYSHYFSEITVLDSDKLLSANQWQALSCPSVYFCQVKKKKKKKKTYSDVRFLV